MLNRGDVDGGVVQVISVGCSLDKGVLLLVCAAGRDYVDPVIVSYVVRHQWS